METRSPITVKELLDQLYSLQSQYKSEDVKGMIDHISQDIASIQNNAFKNDPEYKRLILREKEAKSLRISGKELTVQEQNQLGTIRERLATEQVNAALPYLMAFFNQQVTALVNTPTKTEKKSIFAKLTSKKTDDKTPRSSVIPEDPIATIAKNPSVNPAAAKVGELIAEISASHQINTNLSSDVAKIATVFNETRRPTPF